MITLRSHPRRTRDRSFVPRALRVAALLLIALALPRIGTAQDDMEQQSNAPPNDLVARSLGLDPARLAGINAEQKKLADAIGLEVVCLCGTCPRHTITECDCGAWAVPNKKIIQAAVVKGLSRDEIIQAYRQAYGDKILAMLPNEGFARAAWLLPYAVAVVGLAMVFLIGFRYMRRAGTSRAEPGSTGADSGPAASDDARKQLARELEELD